jgi:hypothetical protein
MVKVQIYSDIHLEFLQKSEFPKIAPLAPFLILAGDVGHVGHKLFEPFMEYVSSNWERVYYVLGNHELYSSSHTIDKMIMRYKECIEKYSNIILLDKDVFEDTENDIVFVGCTLWSNYNKEVPNNYVNCLTKIKSKNSKGHTVGITREYYNNLNLEHTRWLYNTLHTYHNRNILVITHYPCIIEGTSGPEYDNEIYKELFANDLYLSNINNNKITCIFGHTHFSNDFTDIHGVRHIGNQFGYREELISGRTNMKIDGLFELFSL